MANSASLKHTSESQQRYIPKLGNVNILRHWEGFFDAIPDALPILGEVHEIRGLILACLWLQCSRILFSQAIGKFITDLIIKQERCEIMEDSNLRRFKSKYREYPDRWFVSRQD